MINRLEDLIIFEDSNYVGIHKGPNVPSIPEREKTGIKSIYDLASEKGLLICHRLDKGTSGVMVLAKTADAHRELNLKFQNKEVNKFYHAIVEGGAQFENLEVDLPLSTTSRKVFVDKQDGKKALTLFSTLEKFQAFSLIECQPKTGRQHQIRVHLQSQNHPIVGDKTYGGGRPRLSDFKKKFNGTESAELIQRFALHARRIEFDAMDSSYSITCDYEKDFEVLLKIIRKWNR